MEIASGNSPLVTFVDLLLNTCDYRPTCYKKQKTWEQMTQDVVEAEEAAAVDEVGEEAEEDAVEEEEMAADAVEEEVEAEGDEAAEGEVAEEIVHRAKREKSSFLSVRILRRQLLLAF